MINLIAVAFRIALKKSAEMRLIMKRKMTALLLTVGMTVAVIGCGSKTANVSSASSVSSAASASIQTESTDPPASADPASADSSSSSAETTKVDGVVIDAAMHSLVLQTKDGQTINASTGENASPDTSGLKNGLLLGNGITLTYSGNPLKTVSIISEADCATKSSDADGLAAAGSVILAVEDKDLDALIDCVTTYPVHIGIGKGLTIKDAAQFKEKVKASELFTDKLVDSVSHTDLLDLEESKAGIVLCSGSESTPNIILSKDKSGNWGITDINLTK